MITGSRVAVTTGAGVVVAQATAGDRRGVRVTLQNKDATNSVFLGGSNVSSTVYGHELAVNGGTITLTLDQGEQLYGVTAAGTVQLNVLTASA